MASDLVLLLSLLITPTQCNNVTLLPSTPSPCPAGLVFLAGLGSGVTEAVLIVTPADVCKIRMQAQNWYVGAKPADATTSLAVAVTSTTAGIPGDSSASSSLTNTIKYRGFIHTAAVIVREEGVGALYKGLAPTVLRQGCNQVMT